MPALNGQRVLGPIAGMVTPTLTPALNGYRVDYWPPSAVVASPSRVGAVRSRLPVLANGRAITGTVARSYLQDYYNRVHVIPGSLALGNLITAQQRSASVWNAWLDRNEQITSIALNQLDSIALSGQGAVPLTMMPLQMLTWAVSIDVGGSATLNGSIDWQFADGYVARLPVTGNRITAWTFTPDWNGGITERLEWLTLVERSTNGNETSTPLRECPRRSWEFQPVADGAVRQRMEAMLYDGSARNWAVPVFADQSVLAAPLSLGALTISLDTASLDFRAGGLAILHASALKFEVVQVDAVSANAITLKVGTQAAWPAGTRLFPVRLARLEDWPQIERYSSNVVRSASVRFVAVDANDWPAQMPSAVYRSIPVLETRPEWSENPRVKYARDVTLIDGRTGAVYVDDVTGMAWPTQTHRWQLYGRADRDGMRRLLYALQGRSNYLWLPTWSDDLTLVGQLTAGDYAMQVKWHGYAAYLHQQPGRRDIRIELVDGSVLYRRINGSIELSNDVEQLSMETAWASTIQAQSVVRISFMGLARLNSDAVEIQHLTDIDGVAACAVTFAQVTANG